MSFMPAMAFFLELFEGVFALRRHHWLGSSGARLRPATEEGEVQQVRFAHLLHLPS